MSSHHRSYVWCIMMRGSRRWIVSTVGFFVSFDFFVQSIDKPTTLPNRDVVSLFPSETYVIHQQKDLFQKDMFVTRRQAKKSSRLTAWRPLTPPYSVDIGCAASYRYQARYCPLSSEELRNISLACADRTSESWFCQ